MELFKNKTIITVLLLGLLLIVILVLYQAAFVQKAHSTFENYYAFRGCEKLITRTKDYATCKINSRQTIKIVRYHDKWYLDGDLPVCNQLFCW